jgi:hypothetical protein
MVAVFNAICGSGKDAVASQLVAAEGVRLLKQIVKITPPGKQAEGAASVRSDLTDFIAEADPAFLDYVEGRKGTGPIDFRIKNPESDGITRLVWGRIARTEADIHKAHIAVRLRGTGKIPRSFPATPETWRSRVVVPRGVREPYIRKMQARVGRWRASWAESLSVLSGVVGKAVRPAPWVRRHIPSPQAKTANVSTLTGPSPSVTFGSQSPGVSRQRSLVESAMKIRAETMKRRAAFIISGFNRDLKRGMIDAARAKREARRSAEQNT